jgi:hypothetical protein
VAQVESHTRSQKAGIVHANIEKVNTVVSQVRTRAEDVRSPEGGVRRLAWAAKRQALLEGLNRDLAGEYQAVLMYTHYSAKLTGPYRRKLRPLFPGGDR